METLAAGLLPWWYFLVQSQQQKNQNNSRLQQARGEAG